MMPSSEIAWLSAGAVAGFLLLVVGWLAGRRSGKKKN